MVAVFTATICYIPWIIYFVKQGIEWHTDRELYYIFPFVLGIIAARYKIFDRLVKISDKHILLYLLISTITVAAAALARTQLCLVFDPFFALAVIGFVIAFIRCMPKAIVCVFEFLGNNSSYMFMIHLSLLTYVWSVDFSTKGARFIY